MKNYTLRAAFDDLNKLNEDGYTEYEKNFDYGTSKRSEIGGQDIFDVNKVGSSYYDNFLDDLAYMQKAKNKTGKIVQLSPNEYLDICVNVIFKANNATKERLLQSRRLKDKDKIDYLVELIKNTNKKFPITYLDLSSPSQEGLHRMIAAGEAFGYDTKFPVLIVNWYDKDRLEKERQEETRSRIKKAVEETLRYTFSDMHEFEDELRYKMDDEFEYDDYDGSYTIKYRYDDNNLSPEVVVTLKGVSYIFNSEKIKRGSKNNS